MREDDRLEKNVIFILDWIAVSSATHTGTPYPWEGGAWAAGMLKIIPRKNTQYNTSDRGSINPAYYRMLIGG